MAKHSILFRQTIASSLLHIQIRLTGAWLSTREFLHPFCFAENNPRETAQEDTDR